MALPDILHHQRESFPAEIASNFVAGVDRGDIEQASRRLSNEVIRTPLFPYMGKSTGNSTYLKAENLQTNGSFKIRCSLNAILGLSTEELSKGVYTASTGNFALGVTRAARARAADVRVYVTETAAKSKLDTLRDMGAEIVCVSPKGWWEILCGETPSGESGTFLHPCSGRAVIVGDATIGQEILEDLPDVDAILVPFGGGGLSMGISLACTLWRSKAKIYACETAAATPYYSALAAGRPVEVPVTATPLVTSIGVPTVLESSWPLLKATLDGVVVSSLEAIAHAVYQLAKHNHFVVEGGGAAALAAAHHSFFAGQRVVAVLSGGTIDTETLASVLMNGGLPPEWPSHH
jgi:threonine dehydratase